MPRKRSWTIEELKKAISSSRSKREVLKKINLRPTGGNYKQLEKYIEELHLDIAHFTGQGWNKGLIFCPKPKIPISKLLRKGVVFQSYKLKKRLFAERIKDERCEQCGWAVLSEDGRIPLEINHKNGNSTDNRIENLEILCPNCHSLKPYYRGSKLRKDARVAELVYAHHLK